ncbi:RNA-binding S4 domain-containing protein [Crocinitomicaceae bacterium]|nr:RNA-binding S4 domain-containing protein [Crocinitomicaceae bacterium]
MSTRLDKYVWSVRLAKTRSQAADAISKGRVKLNGENIKPAKYVKVGDEINIHKHTSVFTFKVLQLLDRRVGAKLVPDYLLDITPEEEIEKLKMFQLSQKSYRHHGTGKPTKKDRRDLDDFLENW